ncbi:MAG: hypothetical protein AB2L20_12825 [Mangrovibacterium sp.]
MKYVIILITFMLPFCLFGQEVNFKVNAQGKSYQPELWVSDQKLLFAPEEGLWSVAARWENNWPSGWKHVSPDRYETSGDWQILYGALDLGKGKLFFRDAYRQEGNLVKCIRRFEWQGQQSIDSLTLSVRWQVPGNHSKPFLPGILYYGNPSGEKNGADKVPFYHGNAGEQAIFEEHRYPMPFASLECISQNGQFGAALHTQPSPVSGGNHFDQWWSMGVRAYDNFSELVQLSGPITYNGKPSLAKATQTHGLPYGGTWMKMVPGTVIEKTFYLQAYPVTQKGSGFIKAVDTSISLFKPFCTEDLPCYRQIVDDKYRFAKSRYMQDSTFAGFNMFPGWMTPEIVMGWCGQAEAPGYALQVLAKELKDPGIRNMVQKSLDFISTSPVINDGFCTSFNTGEKNWSNRNLVSMGQAMNNIAMAIRYGRKNKTVNTEKWEKFLRQACDVQVKRIEAAQWSPRNTAEAFLISPLLLSSELFGNKEYKQVALKMADYYGKRHFNMDEPYWGGTLDANCEDKEGAGGAFQGFMAAWESTRDKKYLEWAKHAGYTMLSYTVVWDIPLPAGRLADHGLKTRGWTVVSPQNQHLDVFGLLFCPLVYKLGDYLNDDSLKKLSKVMFLSCGQMIDPFGSQGEQATHTNFAQHGDMSDVYRLRGGYSESWTVFWITAHFLNAAAQFEEMGIRL